MLSVRCIGSARFLAIMTVFSSAASANDADAYAADNPVFNAIDQITVIGSVSSINQIAGSVTLIGPAELDIQVNTDALRILRTVPGVNIQEEEGFGLRPNIGIRGTGSDRSGRILLLEDGVPIAPAPYAAPSAYYFPSAGRINAFEVTKGPGVIKYGAFTTGGAINMFSTPIPEKASASVDAFAGEFSELRLHAWAGGRTDALSFADVGFLIETFQHESDGFKDIDSFGDGRRQDTGLDVEDYVVKLGFYSKDGAALEQSLELKYQHRKELSNQTYLGLTQDDFEADPFRLYRASQLDNIQTDHDTYQATHRIDFSGNTSLTTLGYYTDFARNWFKIEEVNATGNSSSDDVSVSAILADPVTFADEFEILLGADGFVSADNALVLRNNNRSYYAWGGQTALSHVFATGGMEHDITASLRYHEDQVDRFQHEADYRIDNGVMVLTTLGAPGSQANRLQDATSFAAYLEDRITIDRLTLTLGGRYENITTMRRDFSTAGPTRAAGPTGTRENSYGVFLYSAGAVFQASEEFSILAGVHKGFSPPSPSNVDAEPERSTNIETGGRYRAGAFNAELIGYFNNYKNLLGDCTNSTGGNCIIGDSFDAGKVHVYGLEAVVGYDLAAAVEASISLPIKLVYSYTSAEFKEGFDSDFGPWGNVERGFELPYVPAHQLTMLAGVHGERWGGDLALNYVSEARATAGAGATPQADLIDARIIVDASTYFEVRPGIRIKAKVENLFDEIYNAARRPAGLRPGKPRQAFIGVQLDL